MKYDFDLLIKRTHRKKTLSIIIRDQKVILSAPKYVSDQEINKILESKFAWIQKKLTIEKEDFKLNKKYYTSGEIFLYLGKEYYLDIKKNTKSDIYISHNKLIIETTNFDDNNLVKNEIRSWYMKKAKERIELIHKHYEIIMNLKSNKLIFGEYKSKWGSCNIKKVISYDWRIIMSPITVINYIVVHEISHLLHPNHSKYFWSLVEKYIKDYKEPRKWLRLNSKKLIL
ncbi:MAG: hypothetical protein CMJ14_03375 [Pelagibacterales bacterium]|nr:hypothetical protein [Pelagibacterales bacterium]